jgi:exosortase
VEGRTARLSSPTTFLLLWTFSVAASWHSLASTFALAWNSDEYTHILLILPVSAALIWFDWPTLRALSAPNPKTGSVLLLVALLLASGAGWWSRGLQPDVRLSFDMLALVIWWIGSFVLCFGTRSSITSLFPLVFLFWMVPFPQFLLRQVVSLLQQGSAFAADMLFAGVGVPVAQDGLRLSIPGLTLEVAQECSSIRSSMMLLVTTMVLAQLTLRSPWRKALLIASAVPLAVAKNGLRIFTIAMLGTRVDPGFLTGKLHRQGGIVFFSIALAGVFGLIWMLRRAEGEVEHSLNPPQGVVSG